MIQQLDQSITLALNGSDSLFWDNLMMCVTNTFSWSLIIIMLLVIFFRNNYVRDAFIILLTIGLMIFVADRLCSGLVKPMVARWRPTQDPEIMYLIDIVDGYRGGRFGFFSGHACNTFCMATFLSLLFRYKAVTFTLYFWSATTTFTRLYLGVHYFGDVTVGLIVGCLIGWGFYYLYDKVMQRLQSSRLTSDQFTPTGYKKRDMNLFLAVVYFNYICVLLVSMIKGVG
ncbi:MAG: phosphatase PAP2 family protein [Bacteroidaceae bacterium]|nr:phosphatase PAP2 family protein [Bacteroidaceae bacterium]